MELPSSEVEEAKEERRMRDGERQAVAPAAKFGLRSRLEAEGASWGEGEHWRGDTRRGGEGMQRGNDGGGMHCRQEEGGLHGAKQRKRVR